MASNRIHPAQLCRKWWQQKKPGVSPKLLAAVYDRMIARCHRKSHQDYYRYGGVVTPQQT
jgi:hypothetical protein